VRVLVAPDKFRGTLSARQAAEAIARGWRRTDPSAQVEEVPIADGGEGTLDALLAALGGERRTLTVSGPLGDAVVADYAIVRAPEGRTAVIEMARASGLALLDRRRLDPLRATTRGTGELILAACRDGAAWVLVCIGGSATNDGGGGMAQALGIRLLDARDREIGPGGAGLRDLARIDVSGLDRSVARATFVVASDVANPLTGPSGASAVYGPQKGASPEDVAVLDGALRHFAAVLVRDLGLDVRDTPGAGAAGGMGAGLIAFLGARLRPGADVVMEALGLRRRIEGSDLVITGEGRFDRQSMFGKASAGVLRAAEELRVPAIVLCGSRDEEGISVPVYSLVERYGEGDAFRRTAARLADLAAEVATGIRADPSGAGSLP
jgi:glycerate 2-kinase